MVLEEENQFNQSDLEQSIRTNLEFQNLLRKREVDCRGGHFQAFTLLHCAGITFWSADWQFKCWIKWVKNFLIWSTFFYSCLCFHLCLLYIKHNIDISNGECVSKQLIYTSSRHGVTIAWFFESCFWPSGECKSNIHFNFTPSCSVFSLHQILRKISVSIVAEWCTTITT